MNCLLCDSSHATEFAITKLAKQFFQCPDCKLVFLNPKQQMGFFEEKARYQTHNNDIRQPGYRRFLNQMWEPVKERIAKIREPGFSILDFGCGPTDAFSKLAAEDGFDVFNYDPYFFNDERLLQRQYDVVWCSEVFEHFNNPKESVNQALSLVKPGGIMAVMTDPYPEEPEEFIKWGYHNDPTHISFYSEYTMQWVAQSRQPALGFERVSKRVSLFHGPA